METTEQDAREIIGLLDKQETFFVIHARLFQMHPELSDELGIPECSWCGSEITEGQEFFMWGEPMAQTMEEVKDAKYAALNLFCSEDHLVEKAGGWAKELGFEEWATALYR